MATTADPMTAITDLIRARRAKDRRTVVAIAGAPGSGKSTFAAELVAALSDIAETAPAALLPMDGFHLDNEALDARGIRHVKGAPQTFDVEGFIDLVARIRRSAGELAYPLFDRGLDRTIPGAGHLAADVRVVVVEGNYLLLNSEPWSALREMFDVTVMLAVPDAVLHQRLVQRWQEHGLVQDAAVARAEGNDMVNARTVIRNSAAADLTVALSDLPDLASPASRSA